MDANAKEEMKAMMTEIMQGHQIDLLRIAQQNAEKVVNEKIKKTQSELQDVIDEEVAGCSYTDTTFKNIINRSNYEFCRQVNDLWKKTERAIEEKDLEKAKKYTTEGKNIVDNRMTALRLADKDGWDVALAFLSDELASNVAQEKRIKEARKDAAAKRTTSSSKKRGDILRRSRLIKDIRGNQKDDKNRHTKKGLRVRRPGRQTIM